MAFKTHKRSFKFLIKFLKKCAEELVLGFFRFKRQYPLENIITKMRVTSTYDGLDDARELT